MNNRVQRIQIMREKGNRTIQFWREKYPYCKSYDFNLRNFHLIMGVLARKPFEFSSRTVGQTDIFERR